MCTPWQQCCWLLIKAPGLMPLCAAGGYAGLQRVMQWNLEFMARSDQGEAYLELANRCSPVRKLLRGLAFGAWAWGGAGRPGHALSNSCTRTLRLRLGQLPSAKLGLSECLSSNQRAPHAQHTPHSSLAAIANLTAAAPETQGRDSPAAHLTSVRSTSARKTHLYSASAHRYRSTHSVLPYITRGVLWQGG